MATEIKTSDSVAVITINRPEHYNALTTGVLEEIADYLISIDTDDKQTCAIITGAGEHFAAGADVRELAAKDAHAGLYDPRVGYWRAIRSFRKPLITAVEGYCLGGGCELAMMGDIIVAGKGATFGQPEVKLGIMPGAGGTQRLTAAIGKAKSMKIILTGESMDAHEAFTSGLISELTEKGSALARALEIANVIAQRPKAAIRLAKEAVLAAAEHSLVSGLAQERRSFELLLSTKDKQEGITAFLEKRKPVFSGS
ncbi:MAG: enoyl-CoA hydratase-related protein [Arenicellales bacterium]|nr:enoyl-CoA hydratase-related protein [Arenicellales bacterium]